MLAVDLRRGVDVPRVEAGVLEDRLGDERCPACGTAGLELSALEAGGLAGARTNDAVP